MITGVILARNEERNIVDCITALRPHVSEVLMIDMESADQTVGLASPLVDRVLTCPLVPNFDAARNLAIPEAACDWLWFVDADERIPELTGRIVNEWVRERGTEFEAINIPFKSYFCGQWIKHCGWWPGYTCPRVLKRGHFEFSRTLHGGVNLNGRQVLFPASAETGIEHYSFRDLHHYIEKFNRYTSTEALQLAERGIDYDWRGALRFMVHDLWQHYELNLAKLDGERGWIVTWLASQYRWLSVTKLIDHGKSSEARGGPSSVPRDLDEFVRALEEELASFRTDHPEPPLGIVWRAPIWDLAAGVMESRTSVLALMRSDRPITVEALPGARNAELPASDHAAFRALERCRRAKHVVTVTQWGSLVIPPDRCASHNVMRIPAGMEVPEQFIRHVDSYDEVWVTTPQESLAFQAQGIAPERLRVVSSIVQPQASDQEQQLASAGDILQVELARIDGLFGSACDDRPQSGVLRVALEGEFFAGHSFSNVNEQLASHLLGHPSIDLSLQQVRSQVSLGARSPLFHGLKRRMRRSFEHGPEVTIRHAFPPNWQKPATGKWVHIQPWEFGTLPNDWLPSLRDQIDEIWVMSRYVEAVYLKSGIPPEKIRLIPWGIDPGVFQPEAPARRLPSDKTFRFLYVGGTILRKGFDRVLAAYLEEFGPQEDVCLVVKDVGTQTFYGPQSMRGDVLAAMESNVNPAIAYLDNEMTPGQLAGLYTACNCLVAPYRGEGFGLPVLEALACGVPAIVPEGGPTDDFVDVESGFLLGSTVVPAEGVINLCGPATELEISMGELRATMRQAFDNQTRTRELGCRGSARVRREFTWQATVDKMVDRMHALSHNFRLPVGRTIEAVSSEIDESAAGILRIALVLSDPCDPRSLVESLGRMRPLVTAVSIFGVSLLDEKVAETAEEYKSSILSADGPWPATDSEWVLLLRAGEYLIPEEFERLTAWLKTVPATICRVALADANDGECSQEGPQPFAAVRLVRRHPSLSIDQITELTTGTATVGDSPIASVASIRRIQAIDHANLNTESGSSDMACTTEVRVDSRPAKWSSLATGSIPQSKEVAFGRLGKAVLVQMANGAHLELLEITREHHSRYADRHGMDYWCVRGNPTQGKRAGWGKIPLLLAAIDLGYETVIWLDADAIVVRPDVDLTSLVPHGIGMVRHPNPEHWNTGFIVSKADDQVRSLWEAVANSPENDSAWMEQLAANQLVRQPEFSRLMHPLDLRYNSVPGFASVTSPVIVAGHGMPMDERRKLLQKSLATIGNRPVPPAISCRNQFGPLLNELGLSGEAAEIGVQRGEYSRALLDTWNGRVLHLVDPWRHLSDYDDIANPSDDEAEQCLHQTYFNLRPHVGRFQVHRLTSLEAAQTFSNESLDFVYLDANHAFESVSDDLQSWYPKIRSGGVFAGHDFLDGKLPEGTFGVASAVNKFVQANQLKLQLTCEPRWKSWYFVKP